jgi:hypothetical protein
VEAWLGACRRGDLVRVLTGGVTVALATAPADLEDLVGDGRGRAFAVERVLADRSVKVMGGARRGPRR